MKQIFCIMFAAILALPGCISQRRIAESVRDTAAQIDSIVSKAPRLDTVTLDTYVLPTLTDTVTQAPPPKPIVVDTSVPVAPDTSRFVMALDSATVREQVFDTGTSIVTVTPVTDSVTGAVTLAVNTVTKHRDVPVQVVIPTPEPVPSEPVNVTWLHFLLFTLAGLGLAAQMFLKWQQNKR